MEEVKRQAYSVDIVSNHVIIRKNAVMYIHTYDNDIHTHKIEWRDSDIITDSIDGEFTIKVIKKLC